MAKKKIEMTIEGSCSSCPFCSYDPHYTRSTDSGYNCTHSDAPRERIADDSACNGYNTAREKWKKDEKELLPMFRSDKPVDPMLIPNWCPLSDAE